MLKIEEDVSLRPKTTLRIGGEARWYAELQTKKDCEDAVAFVEENGVPLFVLGAGSNTIFADGTIDALVVRIKAAEVHVDENTVTVSAGKNLAQLINELADHNLDLSPLTGIPGLVGGAVFGNAGQGFGDIWISSFINKVEAFVENKWKTFKKEDLEYGYRASTFKKWCHAEPRRSMVIWSVSMNIPSGEKVTIQAEIERLLKKRIDTQPHVKTAGSCFLSVSKDQPAWKLIDAAGLRGKKIGNIQISEKHTNFLINGGDATFKDTKKLIEDVRSHIDQPMTVEMRLVEKDGSISF